jgi:hypothetical protein
MMETTEKRTLIKLVGKRGLTISVARIPGDNVMLKRVDNEEGRRMERACFENGTRENCKNCKKQLSYR